MFCVPAWCDPETMKCDRPGLTGGRGLEQNYSGFETLVSVPWRVMRFRPVSFRFCESDVPPHHV
jgi:hypothetical protein